MKAMNKFLRIEPKVRCLPDTHMPGHGGLGHGAGGTLAVAFSLLRRHQGYHSCGGARQAGGGHGSDLRDPVRQVASTSFRT